MSNKKVVSNNGSLSDFSNAIFTELKIGNESKKHSVQTSGGKRDRNSKKIKEIRNENNNEKEVLGGEQPQSVGISGMKNSSFYNEVNSAFDVEKKLSVVKGFIKDNTEIMNFDNKNLGDEPGNNDKRINHSRNSGRFDHALKATDLDMDLYSNQRTKFITMEEMNKIQSMHIIPTVFMNGVESLSYAKTDYNPDDNVFGLQIPVRISFSASSGNFYNRKINQVQTFGYSSTTGKKILEGKTKNPIIVQPQQTKSFYTDSYVEFFKDSPEDQTLLELFRKCAPFNSTLPQEIFPGSRNGDLIINFKSIVQMDIQFINKPSVITGSLTLNCPK
ncbi:hypothetical protein BB558_001997 [Smittium angustum]|uniref:Uncharacterized protein n=1 Tax=Smittium angustum TaxID=133377 RepID=A0A2U1J9V4_SMIAN|nr:hypothetical protein BB558_001997 [Smittium angustum]